VWISIGGKALTSHKKDTLDHSKVAAEIAGIEGREFEVSNDGLSRARELKLILEERSRSTSTTGERNWPVPSRQRSTSMEVSESTVSCNCPSKFALCTYNTLLASAGTGSIKRTRYFRLHPDIKNVLILMRRCLLATYVVIVAVGPYHNRR